MTNTFTFHHSKWIKNHFFTPFIDGNQSELSAVILKMTTDGG